MVAVPPDERGDGTMPMLRILAVLLALAAPLAMTGCGGEVADPQQGDGEFAD
jgi:hypothetical protein